MKYKRTLWDIDGTLYDTSNPWNVSRETEKDLIMGRRKLESLSKEQLSCFVPYEDLPELMKNMPQETQGIISNGGHQYQIDKLKLLGLYGFVNPELIFTSYGEIEKILKDPSHPLYSKTKDKTPEEIFLELRRYTGKPNTYMFERALEKPRLDAKECVLIGDDWKDIEGAQRIGMNNILISSDENPIYNPFTEKIITPDYRINKGDIRELRRLLMK